MYQKKGYLQIGDYKFGFEQIEAGNFLDEKLSKYEIDSLLFCQKWLNDLRSFTIQTSGSTGKPKSITISRAQAIYSACATIDALGLHLGCKSLICINTQYIGGLMMLIRGLEFDMQMTLIAPSSNPFAALTQNNEYDFIALVPMQLELGLDTSHSLLNSCHTIIVGGAALNDQIKTNCQSLKSTVYETYGMTETVSHIALKTINGTSKSDHFTSIGDVQLSTNNQQTLEISGTATDHEKIITNDRVTLINKHSFLIHGRIDNIVNSGGIKIEIEKLEQQINPLLKEIYRKGIISSLPDDTLGEKIVLILEGTDPKSEEIDRLKEQFKVSLDKYMIPKEIFYVASIPRTRSGKYDRIELKTLIEQR